MLTEPMYSYLHLEFKEVQNLCQNIQHTAFLLLFNFPKLPAIVTNLKDQQSPAPISKEI